MLILRAIKQKFADETANKPEQILSAREGRKIYLKDFGKNYLKLVVAEEGKNKVIITAHWLDKKKVKK